MGRTKFWSIKNITSLYLSLIMHICHYNTRGAGSVAKVVAGSPPTMLLYLRQLLFALVAHVTHATHRCRNTRHALQSLLFDK